MEELMRLAFIEGYKQRALSGGKIFDETSKAYADALFDKWIDKGQKLPIQDVIQSDFLCDRECSGENKCDEQCYMCADMEKNSV